MLATGLSRRKHPLPAEAVRSEHLRTGAPRLHPETTRTAPPGKQGNYTQAFALLHSHHSASGCRGSEGHDHQPATAAGAAAGRPAAGLRPVRTTRRGGLHRALGDARLPARARLGVPRPPAGRPRRAPARERPPRLRPLRPQPQDERAWGRRRPRRPLRGHRPGPLRGAGHLGRRPLRPGLRHSPAPAGGRAAAVEPQWAPGSCPRPAPV